MHEELVGVLEARYVISKFPLLEDFLGVQMIHNANGSISLNNFKYLHKLVEEYIPTSGAGCCIALSPMSTKFNDEEQDIAPPADLAKFRKLLGKLMFMARTRHDIAFAVNRLAARAHHATALDMEALVRVVRYLKGTPAVCLTYYPSTPETGVSAVQFEFFVDCATTIYSDFKGQTGVCARLGTDHRSAMFFARTCKQKVVSTGSCHCEAIGAVETIKAVIWFRNIAAEIGFAQVGPTIIYCDNMAMIQLFTAFSGNHKRVKHFMHAIAFAMDQVEQGVVLFKYLDGTLHPADGLSKPKAGQPQREDVIRLQGTPWQE
jgi:hypothetical protein